jgi:hypothetical protein
MRSGAGETIGARWDEIDMKAKLWTIPRRNAETIDALGRPTFKKRQGTKSREGIRVAVRHRHPAGNYSGHPAQGQP